jgi:predicted LPLAT superfamily acyltransferase
MGALSVPVREERAAAAGGAAGAVARPQPAGAPSGIRPPAETWLEMVEKGSLLGIWFLVVVGRLLGRGFARLLLKPVVLYFVALTPAARRASRDYLRRMQQPHDFRAVYAHCLRFAHCTLDRLFWAQGREALFQVTRTGSEHLQALARERRGALLIGAHLGSFEALRGMAARRKVALNIVGYFKNARLINSVLERLNPGLATRVIAVERNIDFVLRLKERIDAGELVALLGDRVGLGDRTAEVELLGGRALLPSGPYLLAAALGCPVYLCFGLFHEPNRYDLYCEPFAERIELPRRTRAAGARAYTQQFARRLEHYCRLAPDNWFNFYELWKVQA